MPYVNSYYKCQVLTDRKLYLKEFYSNRIYSEYYHEKFGFNDSPEKMLDTFPVPEEDLKKIKVSWNSGLGDFGRHAGIMYWLRTRHNCFFFRTAGFKYQFKPRKNMISCRFGTNYCFNTISESRQKTVDFLRKKYEFSTGKLNHDQYIYELCESNISISPFGYGEICAGRDFETFVCGAALFKPDMSHLQTWPDFYIPEKTYVPYKWDFSDIMEKVEFYLEKDRWAEIAQAGQEKYRYYIETRQGKEEFVAQFLDMFSNK